MITALALILVLLLLVALPHILEKLRRPMDDEARAFAPGEIIELSQGKTHIHMRSTGRGPLAICIHGLTTPEYVWDDVAARLLGMGYRVLSYDLYGRGFSDRPDATHDRAFYIKQLEDVIEAANSPGSFTLFGFSMGGGIATAYAAQNPERVERLVLLAPTGLMLNEGTMARVTQKMPYMGDWLMRSFGGALCKSGLLGKGGQKTEIEKRQAKEVRYRGFIQSVQSSRKNFLRESAVLDHEKLQFERVPTLAIFGGQDDVIPLGALGRLAQANRAAHHEMIESAGHRLPYTHAAEIIETYKQFLQHR